jgi:hypothetical protein
MKEADILEFQRSIVLRVDTASYGDLVQMVDEFETEALASQRTTRMREKCSCALASFRLLLAQLKEVPIADATPLAETLLSKSGCEPFQILQSVGAFAVYCEERGNAQAGAALLQAALNRVVWDTVTVKLKNEARDTYERLFARMMRAG